MRQPWTTVSGRVLELVMLCRGRRPAPKGISRHADARGGVELVDFVLERFDFLLEFALQAVDLVALDLGDEDGLRRFVTAEETFVCCLGDHGATRQSRLG